MSVAFEELVRGFEWKIPEVYNVGEALCHRGASNKLGDALVYVDNLWNSYTFSFSWLNGQSNRLANALTSDGLSAGDRVAVILPPSVESAIAHLAILKAGMISVPLPTTSGKADIAQKLESAGVAAILTTAGIREASLQGGEGMTTHRLYILIEDEDAAPGAHLNDLLAENSNKFAAVPTTVSTPAFISFTSGSEGLPKGVLQGHGLVLGILPAFHFSKIPRPGERVWSSFDWGWLGGLLVALGSWHFGATIVIQRQERIVPSRTLRLLREFHVSRISVSPTALKLLRLASKDEEFPTLVSLTIGGERLEPELREWARRKFGTDVSEMYGLTECSGVMGSGHILPVKPGAIGKPAPGQTLCILDEDGNPQANGDAGFIAVKSPHPAMFIGYWQDEPATRAKFCGPWLLTGDLGYRDDDGYFWYVGRADDVITCGGRRIGPGEIEAAFAEMAEVRLCAAIGVPHEMSNERIVGWVELKERAAVSSNSGKARHQSGQGLVSLPSPRHCQNCR